MRKLQTHGWSALALAALTLLTSQGCTAGWLADRRAQRAAEAENDDEDTDKPANLAGLPAGTKVQKDLAYGPAADQKLDVYAPPNAKGAPVIFMVHGGAWMFGDKGAEKVVANKTARWLPKGFVMVMPNYRMLPKNPPVGQAADVGLALAYAQQHAAQWGGDPNRFILMGHSAGAHLVSLVSADPGIALGQGAKPWLGTVALDSASMDVVATMEAGQKKFFYNKVFGSDRQGWAEASPYHRLTGQPKPFLLVCSSKREDSCAQAERFAAKVKSLGGKAAVLPQALSHGDINGRLGGESEYTVRVDGFMAELLGR